MAIARQTDASLIKPLNGAKVRRYQLGATTAAGESVAMQADGFIDPAIGTSFAGVAGTLGISVQGGVTGDYVDVVTEGPIKCLTGATPGLPCYVSDTAGEPSETAGTKTFILGVNETAEILYVRPQLVSLS